MSTKAKERSLEHNTSRTDSAFKPQARRQLALGLRSGVLRMQRAAGNQAALRFLQRKCSCGGSCAKCQGNTELPIGPADDRYEREADQTAAHVMRMSDSSSPLLQRKCAHCEEEEQQRTPKQIQRSESAAGPATAPAIVHDVVNSPGRPLDTATRALMEPRF